MRLLDRAHEWAADRFSFVQYPHVRQVGARAARLPLPQRVLLGVIGTFATGIGAFAVAAGAFVLWALIGA